MKNSFCRALLALIFTPLLCLKIPAQQRALKIGDAIPEAVWTTPLQVVNHTSKTITLDKDRDKLILLDFWATWCSSCLANFPKMEDLQRRFGSEVKIVTASGQDRAVLEKFFLTANGKRYSNTVSIAGDKILHSVFPHRGVPYIVWIKNGRLLNTTDADQVTEESVRQVLNDNPSSLQTVTQTDKSRPVMLSQNFDVEKSTALLNYSFVAKGRIRSLDYGTWFHRENGKTYGRQFTNLSLMDIYKAIAYEIFDRLGEQFSAKRLVSAVSNPQQIDFKTTSAADDELYTVDYIVPKNESDSLYSRMLRTINENTPYEAVIRKKMTKCLVLRRTSDKDKIATRGGAFKDDFLKTPSQLQNATLDFMLSPLNAGDKITPLPVIDETDYKGKADLHFSTVKDLKSLQKDLAAYDLALEPAERELWMLVITDKTNHQNQ